jgi:hypothetical protein
MLILIHNDPLELKICTEIGQKIIDVLKNWRWYKEFENVIKLGSK